jgi:hypothetical protein
MRNIERKSVVDGETEIYTLRERERGWKRHIYILRDKPLVIQTVFQGSRGARGELRNTRDVY